jgi:hypothetical protein
MGEWVVGNKVVGSGSGSESLVIGLLPTTNSP